MSRAMCDKEWQYRYYRKVMFSAMAGRLILFYLIIMVTTPTWASKKKQGHHVPGFNKLNDPKMIDSPQVPIEQVPYQCSIVVRRKPYCGGTILSDRIVITAAHCVHPFMAKADSRGVVYNLDSYDIHIKAGVEQPLQKSPHHKVLRLTMHDNYRKPGINPGSYDLGLIMVEPKFKYTNNILPIAITETEPPPGTPVFVSGYGTTVPWRRKLEKKLRSWSRRDTELRKEKWALRGNSLNVVDRDTCKEIYSRQNETVDETMVCAVSKSGNADACQGDSGGPMVALDPYSLTGVVSWGLGCGRSGIPGIYTNVALFHKWIKERSNYLLSTLPPEDLATLPLSPQAEPFGPAPYPGYFSPSNPYLNYYPPSDPWNYYNPGPNPAQPGAAYYPYPKPATPYGKQRPTPQPPALPPATAPQQNNDPLQQPRGWNPYEFIPSSYMSPINPATNYLSNLLVKSLPPRNPFQSLGLIPAPQTIATAYGR